MAATAPIPSIDARLIEVLRRESYDDETLQRVLGVSPNARTPVELPALLRLEASNQAKLGTLVRLFLAGSDVSRSDAENALEPLRVRDLLTAGVLQEVVASRVRATILVVPHDSLLVVGEPVESDAPPDVVPGITTPSLTLSSLTIRQDRDRALDLGTGAGVQALAASRHSEQVIATDVNPRALDFAQLNARLNRCSNVEFRTGSWFEPVADEEFDLVVCNPPYVISPDTTFAFLDSGLEGDAVCRELLRSAPAHLKNGGFATILVSWIHGKEDSAAPLRDWVKGSGCDALVLHHRSDDPEAYVATWTAPLWQSDTVTAQRTTERWLRYLSEQGVELVGSGAVVLRRRSGENWFARLELPLPVRSPATDHLLRIFANQDWLTTTSRHDLVDRPFAPLDAHLLHQTVAFRRRDYEIRDVTLVPEHGIPFAVAIDPEVVQVIFRLSAGRPASVEVDELSRETGSDAAALRRRATDMIHTLVAHGLLVPLEA